MKKWCCMWFFPEYICLPFCAVRGHEWNVQAPLQWYFLFHQLMIWKTFPLLRNSRLKRKAVLDPRVIPWTKGQLTCQGIKLKSSWKVNIQPYTSIFWQEKKQGLQHSTAQVPGPIWPHIKLSLLNPFVGIDTSYGQQYFCGLIPHFWMTAINNFLTFFTDRTEIIIFRLLSLALWYSISAV